jgi:hypothetical protein
LDDAPHDVVGANSFVGTEAAGTCVDAIRYEAKALAYVAAAAWFERDTSGE